MSTSPQGALATAAGVDELKSVPMHVHGTRSPSGSVASMDEVESVHGSVEHAEVRGRSDSWYNQPMDDAATTQKNMFRAHHGGVRAAVVEGPGVYYMGTSSPCVYIGSRGCAPSGQSPQLHV
jgi:hypothetical protein